MVWCFTNAPPAIAPYGSKKPLFGTNPICFGAPTGNKIPFVKESSSMKKAINIIAKKHIFRKLFWFQASF